MTNNDDKPISGQAVLRSTADAQVVMEEFERAGFEVGPLYANSFSISGDLRTFETYFNADFESSSTEGIMVKTKEGSVDSAIPHGLLPANIRDKIVGIVFSKPPDFGPSGDY